MATKKLIFRPSWSFFGKILLLFLMSWGFLWASTANAALFLNLGEDIKGESTDKDHKDWIVLNSFDWGVTNSARQSSSGGGSGKVTFSDLTITKPVDTSSPKLLQATSSGTHFSEAKLDVTRLIADKQQTYLEFKFQEVLVSGYQISGTADTIPTETLTLNFSKIEEIFTQFDDKGSVVQQVNGTAVATTPIPASLLLLSSGLIALIGFRRR